MDTYEIEQIISLAVEKRPKFTSAPMNLYVHKNKLICGARIVMPREAAFVAHLTPQNLQDGFDTRQWKIIVQEIIEIVGAGKISAHSDINSAQTKLNGNNKSNEDRRRELRLSHRSHISFAGSSEKELIEAKMRDVSSGGMSFACRTNSDYLQLGSEITTHFSVPRFNIDRSFDKIKFTRTGLIRRVDKIDPALYCIALQFANPLPFKPAENYYRQAKPKQKLATTC